MLFICFNLSRYAAQHEMAMTWSELWLDDSKEQWCTEKYSNLSRQKEKLFQCYQLFKVEKLTCWSELHNFWKWELVFLTGVVKCDLFKHFSNILLVIKCKLSKVIFVYNIDRTLCMLWLVKNPCYQSIKHRKSYVIKKMKMPKLCITLS